MKPVILGAPGGWKPSISEGGKPFLPKIMKMHESAFLLKEKYSFLQKLGAGNLHELKRLPELTFLFLKGEGSRPPGALTIQGFVRQRK